MQRLFILALSFVIVLGSALGVLLYVSLIPFFHEIGIAATCLLILAIACTAILLVVFTFSQVGCMLSKRNHAKLASMVVSYGDVVAAVDLSGNWVHLSAIHEHAKIPPPTVQAISQKKQEPYSDRETVLELFHLGNSLRDISTRTGVSYHYVQKWTSEEKKTENT